MTKIEAAADSKTNTPGKTDLIFSVFSASLATKDFMSLSHPIVVFATSPIL
jgi:hypothetical protein